MESYRVFDNFLTPEDLATVRQSALDCGFGTWAPASQSVLGVNSFAGVGYMGRHDIILRSLSGRMRIAPFPREMKFRVTGKDAGKSYIHSDRTSGDLTCILYLSDETDSRSGTGFYRYISPTLWLDRATEMPPYENLVNDRHGQALLNDMRDEDFQRNPRWEQTDFVRGLLNRAVVFRAPLFHARLPAEGLGDSDATARMVHVTHFYL